MVECNRMRYFACFLPSQRMEHLKTLIYVLTGVVPRNQVCAFEQKKSSALLSTRAQAAYKSSRIYISGLEFVLSTENGLAGSI